jgi:hypothetical protein
VINLYNNFGLEETVYILLWDKYKLEDVRNRWEIFSTSGTFRHFTLPVDDHSSTVVMLARPPVQKNELPAYTKQLTGRITKAKKDFPDWSLKMHFDNQKERPELNDLMFISLAVPRSEFKDAKKFAMQSLIDWIPDASWTFEASKENFKTIKPGLLRREGSLPLWESPRTALTIEEPNLHFLYSNEEKPFESPWWYWWRGRILIRKDGVYSFSIESDDGSDFWLNDKKIIDNMGDHAMLRASNAVNLKHGFHKIEIRYYDGVLGAGLKVEVREPGEREWKPIPANWLYHFPHEGAIPWKAK